MIQATFTDLIEAAEQLPFEEQEDQNHLRDRKRAKLVKEFAQGKYKSVTPEQIMEEILL
jgi:hypothetical protein